MLTKIRNLYLKDDRALLAVSLVVLAGVFALMALRLITVAEGSMFLAAAFGFPSLIGARSSGSPPPSEPPPAAGAGAGLELDAADLSALPSLVPESDVQDDTPPPTRRDPPVGPAAAALLLAAGLTTLAGPSACAPPPPATMTPEQRLEAEHQADATYRAHVLACAAPALYPTRAESDACAARVRAEWHRLPDGGAALPAGGVQ